MIGSFLVDRGSAICIFEEACHEINDLFQSHLYSELSRAPTFIALVEADKCRHHVYIYRTEWILGIVLEPQ